MSSKWTDRISQALGLRLAAWYLATFLASTLVIGGLTYGLLASSLETRDHDIIQSTLREYAARYQAGGLPALARAIELEQRSGQREPLFVRLVGPFEDVLLYSLPETWGVFDLHPTTQSPRGGGPGSSELAGGPNAIWEQVRARDRNAVLEVATLPLGGGTVLQVGKTSESRDELLSRFRRVLLLGLTAALAIGMIGGFFLTRSTLKPLRDLRDAVQRILRTGQTDDRVPVYGNDDAVDELSDLFNAMLARITTLIHGMRNALDHVAHDLRTPMTRLRVTAETALASNDPARQREALSDVLEESDRVLSMLTTLMDISEAETGTMTLTRTEVDVATLVAEVIDLYEDTAQEAGVTVSSSVAPGVAVSADRDRLRQALANLVDNAIKYTPRGGQVDISAAHDGDCIAIRVRDTGAGIPTHDLPRIFDRLYRGDQSRATRGLGLGLSLVKAYIEAHRGTVEVESAPGKGSTFTIRLPANPP
jgi:signal transduction histidine kinase